MLVNESNNKAKCSYNLSKQASGAKIIGNGDKKNYWGKIIGKKKVWFNKRIPYLAIKGKRIHNFGTNSPAAKPGPAKKRDYSYN